MTAVIHVPPVMRMTQDSTTVVTTLPSSTDHIAHRSHPRFPPLPIFTMFLQQVIDATRVKETTARQHQHTHPRWNDAKVYTLQRHPHQPGHSHRLPVTMRQCGNTGFQTVALQHACGDEEGWDVKHW